MTPAFPDCELLTLDVWGTVRRGSVSEAGWVLEYGEGISWGNAKSGF